MTKLSKSDQREVNTISLFMRAGNKQTASQLASSFIRSSTSKAVQTKRVAALGTIGFEIRGAA